MLLSLGRAQAGAEQLLDSQHGSDGIGRGRAQPSLHREMLFNLDASSLRGVESRERFLSHAPARVARVGGDANVGAVDLDFRIWQQFEMNYVVPVDGLVEREQPMEAVRTRRSNAETEIDLGE